MARLRRQLTGAGAGLIALAAIGLLLIDGTAAGHPLRLWAADPAARPQPGPSASAAVMLAAVAVITGALCGLRSVPSLAPLIAGLALTGYGLATWPAASHEPVVLGGALLIAALMPGRWTGKPAPRARPLWFIAAEVLGLAVVVILWYLIQVGYLSAAAYANAPWIPLSLQVAPDLRYIAVPLLVLLIGFLAASRPVPRVAALIGGIPSVAVGMVGLFAPALTRHAVDRMVFSTAWQLAILQFAVSGLPLLYGGVLVIGALMPDRQLGWLGLPGQPGAAGTFAAPSARA